MKIPSRGLRPATWAGLLATTAFLGGCYVVPLHPQPATVVLPAAPSAPPAPVTFTARLYPSNDAASGYGTIVAVVTNDFNGRGHFTTNIGGEAFSGEATRTGGSRREGVANGAGQRGSFISCRYAMNTESMGTGSCRHSNGATFSMHLGN